MTTGLIAPIRGRAGQTGGILGKLFFVVLLVIALAVGVVLLIGNLDGIVESGIEEIGTAAAGGDVAVEGVDIGLTTGSGVIRGVTIGNPEGFETAHAFRFDLIELEIDPTTLASDTVVLKKVVIAGPEVIYEWDKDGSNVARIEENVQRFVADLKSATSFGGAGGSEGSKPSGGRKTPGAERTGDDGTRLIIEKLVIKEGRIGVTASMLDGRAVSAALPRIVLHDVGKAEGGLTAGELAGVVMDALTGRVMEAVKGLGIAGLSEKASGVVDDLKGRAGKAIKDLFGGDDDE